MSRLIAAPAPILVPGGTMIGQYVRRLGTSPSGVAMLGASVFRTSVEA